MCSSNSSHQNLSLFNSFHLASIIPSIRYLSILSNGRNWVFLAWVDLQGPMTVLLT